jgi:exodeoxyribonuclease V alpha subunit
MEKIIGHIKHYVFHNEENSYSIARFINEQDEQITIVGYFPKLSEDVTYEALGQWVSHPSYGLQFKVDSIHKSEKQNISGLISYLSSSFFTGIGPKTAEKIVDLLGSDAIDHIIKNKNVLKEVGLNKLRIEKFHQQLIEHQANEQMLVHLYAYQLTGRMAMKLINHYQSKTLDVITKNPYQLIEDIEGIGFIKADEIAFKLGFQKDNPMRIKAGIIYTIDALSYQRGDVYMQKDQLINESMKMLDVEDDVEKALEALVFEHKIILEEDRYYLAHVYQHECDLANHIQRLNLSEMKIQDQSYLETLLDAVEIQKGFNYTTLQKQAIISALTHHFTIITGGPGTGKTTIIEGLLDVYRMYHKLSFKDPSIKEKIALMAPTGRAAKRMKDILGMDAKTIHRHLGYGFDGMFTFDQSSPLSHDLIIIDESSMIDIFLAKKLFEAIKTGAQVVVVGDVDQLPSVGPGQILTDLISSDMLKVVRLKDIHRQAKDSYIIKLASLVNDQKLTHDDLYSQEDVYFIRAHFNQIKGYILSQVKGAIEKGYDLIWDIQVLIPTYKGELGIDQINSVMQATFNPNQKDFMTYKEKTFYTNDKVIQLVNDPDRLIMNGDIGIVKTISKNEKGESYMVVTFDDNDVYYEQSDLEELNLAYAMSIHKSQGSEYPIVIMPMVKPYMHMLKKELIYTAITRSKQYLIMLGDMNLLTYACNNLSEKRQTTLKMRLNNSKTNEDELSPYDFM